jgi:hypothetical protein
MIDRSLELNLAADLAKQKMQSAIPLRQLADPREDANVAAFLASHVRNCIAG